jgi:hypothetical protein
VASDLRCSTGDLSSTYKSFIGGIVPVWILAGTDATGTLSVRFSTDGADPLFLAGFELHDHEPLPIMYRRLSGAPLQGFTPGVAGFVSAFNAGDIDLAESLALAMPDAFERGVALTHLVGWLDGSQHERRHLVDDAMAALAAAPPSRPAVAWLQDELASFQRALDHLAAGGRASAQACPEDGGTGFMNPDCAGQSLSIAGFTASNANAHVALRELRGITAAANGTTVLQDLVAWNAGVLAAGDWEPSPLVFAALKLTGATMVGMHPTMGVNPGDPESVAFGAHRDAILTDFVDLGFAAADFPADVELLLFREYVEQANLPVNWVTADYQDLLSDEQIAASWWGDRVALPVDDPAAPPWARLLREQRLLLRAVADYWLGERLEDGELGGGLGDDVELMIQFGKFLAGQQDQTDRRRLDALDDMVRYTLTGSGKVHEGYFSQSLTDVQHSAEFTTNSWMTTQALFGHTARAFDIGLGVAEHIRYAQDPALAFAAPTALGRLHFKSHFLWTFGPDTSGTKADDILLNGRSMLPAVGEIHRRLLPGNHPMVADLSSWAAAWRDDAFDTAGGKPAGWYGPVSWPDNDFGSGGAWWTHASDPSVTSELSGGVHSYSLDLLRAAYENSTDPDRWRYLVPAVRMFRSVKNWQDAGSPATVPIGSAQWAGSLFEGSTRFAPLVITLLPALANDPMLNTLVDPLGGGETYVDAALIARMEEWSGEQFNGQIAAMLYALGDVSPCGGGFSGKSPQIFEGTYANTVPFLRMLYPLLTKHVIHTDRVPLGVALSNLAVASTGENMIEGIAFEPLVRWRNRLDDGTDLAVQCNHRDTDATLYSAFVYNFEGTPTTTTCVLDEGLVPGRYEVEWGLVNGKCDLFPSGSITSKLQVQKRGVSTSLDLTLAPGLSLVRITRQGDADQPSAGYDLAVDPPVVELAAAQGKTSLRIAATVTNPARAASPPATLELYAALMAPDGSLVTGGGLPPELLIRTWQVPSLPACTGWSAPRFDGVIEFPLGYTASASSDSRDATTTDTAGSAGPAGALLGGTGAPLGDVLPMHPLKALFDSGYGLQVRARVVADGLESDEVNNDQTRGWLLSDLAVVMD